MNSDCARFRCQVQLAHTNRGNAVVYAKREIAFSVSILCCTWTLLSIAAAGQVLPTQQVGRQQDGTVVTTTNQVLTPAGRQVEFEGRPTAVELSPDGRTVALLKSGAAVILIDLDTGAVKQKFDAAGASSSFSGILLETRT